MKPKLIVRVKGGLGNQLFCYAAARRLAWANEAELVIDHVTGFARDRQYRRQYMLDHFRIPARKATPAERMEPFERCRRGVKKLLSRRRPLHERDYVEQEVPGFDRRILGLKFSGTVCLDGYWQSEDYFKDIGPVIREDLRIIPPDDDTNARLAAEIISSPSVALHVRWFDSPGTGGQNVPAQYYKRAVEYIESKITTPRYFLFSDDPGAAMQQLGLPGDRVTVVSHNREDGMAYADLWLMTLCRHFITANSTFSWWGAWLPSSPDKLVTAPDVKSGSAPLSPGGWMRL